MRSKILIFLFLIVFLISFSQEERLRIVIDRDYPPFTFIDEEGNLVGISVEFWKIWSEKTKVKVELVPLEWERAQIEIREGKFDAIDTIFKTEEREKYLDFSLPIFSMTSSIYYVSNLKGIRSLQDITPYIVGVKKGDALIIVSLSQNKNLNFKFYENYKDIIEASKRGEISVFLMDDIPANYYLVKYDLLYKFSKTEPFTTNYLHVAVLNGNSKVLNLINEGISKIKREEIEEIINKYIFRKEVRPEWIFRLIFWIIVGSLGIIFILLTFNRTLNLRLQKETEEVFKLWRYFEGIFEISVLRMKEEEFFQKVLELSLQIVPKSKAGSIFKIEENGARLVKTIGHNKELEGLFFSKEDYISSENGAIVVKGLIEKERSSDLSEKLKKYSIPIKESIIAPIKWQDKLIGHLCLDIPLKSKESFDSKDIQIITQFGRSISVFYVVNEYIREREKYLSNIISVLIKTLEYYDRYTQGHSEGVAKYALKIAERLGFDSEKMRKLYWACLLHDIGKIFIPQQILNKNGRFTKEEYEFVKIHSIKSEEILSRIEELRDISKIIRHHHERWDGKGYPDGLSAEEIPLESRILGIADAFDAMTSERPYKRAFTLEEAIEELQRCKGTQFDPKLVDVFIEILKEEKL